MSVVGRPIPFWPPGCISTLGWSWRSNVWRVAPSSAQSTAFRCFGRSPHFHRPRVRVKCPSSAPVHFAIMRPYRDRPRGSLAMPASTRRTERHPMKIGPGVGIRSRRSFLRRAFQGITGGLLSSGVAAQRLWAGGDDEPGDSLRIVKVEPHLLTGVRGYSVAVRVRAARVRRDRGRRHARRKRPRVRRRSISRSTTSCWNGWLRSPPPREATFPGLALMPRIPLSTR
jgi:hypothetical protein